MERNSQITCWILLMSCSQRNINQKVILSRIPDQPVPLTGTFGFWPGNIGSLRSLVLLFWRLHRVMVDQWKWMVVDHGDILPDELFNIL